MLSLLQVSDFYYFWGSVFCGHRLSLFQELAKHQRPKSLKRVFAIFTKAKTPASTLAPFWEKQDSQYKRMCIVLQLFILNGPEPNLGFHLAKAVNSKAVAFHMVPQSI